MLPYIEHYPVNWINGMKISKHHFQQMENAFQDLIRDTQSIQLTPFNYGLLADGNSRTLEYQILSDKITIKTCRAITVGGIRVEISPLNGGTSELSYGLHELDPSQNDWKVLLIVKPYEREAFGMIDPEETPPREPFTLPAYSLQILPWDIQRQGFQSANQIIIGKLTRRAEGLTWDDQYVPPVANMSAHPLLISTYSDFLNQLEEIHHLAAQVVQSVYGIDNPDNLNRDVRFFTEKLLDYISSRLDPMRMYMLHQPPVIFFSQFVGLARVMNDTLTYLPSSLAEYLVQYFSSRIRQNAPQQQGLVFRQTLDYMLNKTNYNHQDIYQSAVIPVNYLLKQLMLLYSRISTLKKQTWNDIQERVIERKVDSIDPTLDKNVSRTYNPNERYPNKPGGGGGINIKPKN